MRDAYIHQIFAVFCQTQGSLPCSQQPGISPHPELDVSNTLFLNPHLRHFSLHSIPRLGLPSCHIPSGFPTRILKAHSFSQQRSTYPAKVVFLDLLTLLKFGEQYRSWSCSLWNSNQFPLHSNHSGPNTVLITLSCNTLNL